MSSSTVPVEPRAAPRSNRRARAWMMAERWLGACSSLALACAALLTVPSGAHAFSEPRSYFDDPAFGGGGGRWFTASPAEGHGCSVCHTGGGEAPLQVTGLPTGGYVAGASYEIAIAWPAFAARARMLRDLPGVEPPSMGLVAELVSESGLGAGSIDILDPSIATPADLCEVPPMGRAAQVYAVHPGEPTAELQLHCDATALGQRCLVAVLSCGAEQLRFRWTAPPAPVGTVWFGAGFVTTDAVSGTPDGDAVKEVVRPLLAAASNEERYESTLRGTCAVGSRSLATHGDASLPFACGWLIAAALLLLLRVRARRSEMAPRAAAVTAKELG